MAEGNGNPLPEKVWQELRALLNPAAHFHGEYKIVIRNGQIAFTEKLTRTSIAPTDA